MMERCDHRRFLGLGGVLLLSLSFAGAAEDE